MFTAPWTTACSGKHRFHGVCYDNRHYLRSQHWGAYVH